MTDFTPRGAISIIQRLVTGRVFLMPGSTATGYNRWLEALTGVSRETFRRHFIAFNVGRPFGWRPAILEKIERGITNLPFHLQEGELTDLFRHPLWSDRLLRNIPVSQDATRIAFSVADNSYPGGWRTTPWTTYEGDDVLTISEQLGLLPDEIGAVITSSR